MPRVNLLTFIRDSDKPGYALYQCECGTMHETRKDHVNNNHTTSCGHKAREALANYRNKHGHAITGKQSKAYKVWLAMRRRCTDPSHPSYENYGGRGIKVCERWMNSFPAFLSDMGMPPIGMTIDRERVDDNYEPGNCSWATKSQQELNKRKKVYG
jgi:hypothetical protein